MNGQANLFDTPKTYPQEGRVTVDPEYDNRSILTPASGFISEYDYTLNPYSGCAFGCQYCYAASFAPETKTNDPDHPFTRENWGQWVRVKKNAIGMIAAKVRKGELNGKSIYMSSVTDPYQPTERRTNQTNRILRELAKARNLGLVIQTRGPMVDNDEDIALCRGICDNGGYVQVNMTITTNDEAIRQACEKTCPAYQRRLEAITALNGKIQNSDRYTACITMSPLLPTDNPNGFAADLLASGINRFIIQPTHTAKPNRGRFRAATRNEIFIALAEYWKCDPDQEVPEIYEAKYREAVEIIVPTLEKNNCLVGFGRPGFGLPWQSQWHKDQSQRPRYISSQPVSTERVNARS